MNRNHFFHVIKSTSLLLLIPLFGCGSGTPINENLSAPTTVGAYYDQALMFWTEAQDATSYNVYWYIAADSNCSQVLGDYQKLEGLADGSTGVTVTSCQDILNQGTNGGFSGPTPTGTCLTLDLLQGPWGCGQFLCYDISSENADGESRRFSGEGNEILASGILVKPC